MGGDDLVAQVGPGAYEPVSLRAGRLPVEQGGSRVVQAVEQGERVIRHIRNQVARARQFAQRHATQAGGANEVRMDIL